MFEGRTAFYDVFCKSKETFAILSQKDATELDIRKSIIHQTPLIILVAGVSIPRLLRSSYSMHTTALSYIRTTPTLTCYE